MTFRVGQEICCVNDEMAMRYRQPGMFKRFRKYVPLAHNLNKGDVYVVTGLEMIKCAESGIVHQCVHLDGAWHFGHRWMPFPAMQFRAVQKNKTAVEFTTGADPSTEQFDNRRKVKVRT